MGHGQIGSHHNEDPVQDVTFFRRHAHAALQPQVFPADLDPVEVLTSRLLVVQNMYNVKDKGVRVSWK
jgi:hypothetical protein